MKGHLMNKAKLISIIVLAILTAVVILQNVEPVNTKLLFFTLTMPRALLLAITWLGGLVCGLLIPLKAKRQK